MRVVGTWTTEAERAAGDPPAALSAFVLSNIKPTPGPKRVSCASFAISCKSCGYDAFEVASFPIVVPNPSPYFGVAPGETFPRPPHRLKCLNCKNAGTLFDPRTDGYDGALGLGVSYESGGVGEAWAAGQFRVVVSVGYSIDSPELDELAASTGSGLKQLIYLMTYDLGDVDFW